MASLSNPLDAAVLRAQRRFSVQLALQEAVVAVAVCLGGPLILLLLGADIVSGAWLVLLAAGGVGAGLWRWWRARPESYRVAQWLDERWHTKDQIATAYYFLHHPSEQRWLGRQRAGAEDLAERHDVREAVVLRWPRRSWLPLVMMAAIAALWVGRMALEPELRFQPPLPQALGLVSLPTESAEPEEPAIEPEPGDARAAEERPLSADRDDQTLEVEGLVPAGDPLGQTDAETGQVAQDGETPQDKSQSGGQEPIPPDEQTANSLFDQLEKAFEDLLAQLDLQAPSASQGSDGGEASDQGTAPGEMSSPQEGMESPGEQASGEGMEAEPGGEGEAEISEFAQDGGSGEGAAQDSPTDAVSTAGQNDGDKWFDEAHHMQVLGQLEELYSQRSEEVSGEMFVETERSAQSAGTPLGATNASHRRVAGTVDRDQIPMGYQTYIKSYFRELESLENR